jgi:hypothetical protein
MITFCAQMEIDRSREQVWDWMLRDFPPEHRHTGTVNLEAIAAEVKAKNAPDSTPPKPDRVPSRLSMMEVLDWNEGHAFAVRFSDKPYLQGLVADVWLEETGLEKSLAHVRLELTLGFLLTFPVGVIYRLLQQRVDSLILQSLAEMRYEVETGKKFDAKQGLRLSLNRIQKVDCQQA